MGPEADPKEGAKRFARLPAAARFRVRPGTGERRRRKASGGGRLMRRGPRIRRGRSPPRPGRRRGPGPRTEAQSCPWRRSVPLAGDEDQEQRERDEAEQDEPEQDVCAQDAGEPRESPAEGLLHRHRFAPIPADRVFRHGAGDDAREDGREDERRDGVEEKATEVQGRERRRSEATETPADENSPENGERKDDGKQTSRGAQGQVHDEEWQEVLRPYAEQAG